MCSVKIVFKEIMATGYDPHKEALDVIMVPDLDGGIGTRTVRFIQGFTRATCAITILTCAIDVLAADPGLAEHCESAAPILESCVIFLCNFRDVSSSEEFYEMLRFPGIFPCCVCDALPRLFTCDFMMPVFLSSLDG
jgi:hypothetical protein